MYIWGWFGTGGLVPVNFALVASGWDKIMIVINVILIIACLVLS